VKVFFSNFRVRTKNFGKLAFGGAPLNNYHLIMTLHLCTHAFTYRQKAAALNMNEVDDYWLRPKSSLPKAKRLPFDTVAARHSKVDFAKYPNAT
jgi:hypothetical protein